MGAGLPMEAGDVAFKCNFATANASGTVLRRRVDRDFGRWGIPLCDYLCQAKLKAFPEVGWAAHLFTHTPVAHIDRRLR
jgi:2,3-bisphosphoglycerate-independent phosphoglycerate mutase